MKLNRRVLKFVSGIGILIPALLVLSLAGAACGGGAESTPAPTPQVRATQTGGPTPSANVDYSRLSGTIEVDGSSTVFPITEAVAEEFGHLTQGKVRVPVGISGTGGGFEKFCNGETAISNASRPIKASEVERCVARGIDFLELPVAIDGLSVVVNPRNDFVQCMTLAELRTLWAPEAERKVSTWSQVRSDWPNQPIRLYGPGVDSGTFDYFTEVINGKAGASRGDYTASEDDNVLVQGVSGDSNGLGYFGYAYYVENTDSLRAVAIDGGGGCVLPTEKAIVDGTYKPLSRPLFIYVRKDAASEPLVSEFVRYYLSFAGQNLVAEAGYVPFPAEVYQLARARFEKGITGSIFGGSNPRKGSVKEVLAANE